METTRTWITDRPEIEAANKQARIEKAAPDLMEKILMYCYTGETWDSTPIRDRAICDIGRMTQRMVAKIADIQQEELGRKIHIKRITE